MASNKTIQLESVKQGFNSHQKDIVLFEDLALSIESGRSHAIIGPSGVGKTSLLLLMAGLETPLEGTVNFKVDNDPQSLLDLKQQSGFIFQQFHLLPELSALHNVALPLKLKGDKQAETKAMQWLERVGLGERAKHKPSELSGGEQQRVAIARAYSASPSFIFADEPTGNLDEATAEQIADLLFDCTAESGNALVIVTHSKALAERADVIYELGHGHLTTLETKRSNEVPKEEAAA